MNHHLDNFFCAQVDSALTSLLVVTGMMSQRTALGQYQIWVSFFNLPLTSFTSNPYKVLDGRKSFPSGHSSTAFSGMFFLSLWVAGQTAAWCFTVPKSSRSLISGRMLTFILTLLPIIWATHVAVTRIQDNVSFFRSILGMR